MSQPADALIIVQARMESTRLPGKVLKPVCGKPMIFHLLERLKNVPCKGMIVAVSENRASSNLAEILIKHGYNVKLGHAENVYKRFLDASRHTDSKAIIRVTADNPLTDCDAIFRGAQKLIEQRLDYLCITPCPKGCGCDIFNRNTFYSFEHEILTPFETEHIIPIFKNRKNLKYGVVPCLFPEGSEKLSLTVDTEEDFQKISAIFKKYYSSDLGIDLNSVIERLMKKS